jgi:hypothetical protein
VGFKSGRRFGGVALAQASRVRSEASVQSAVSPQGSPASSLEANGFETHGSPSDGLLLQGAKTVKT